MAELTKKKKKKRGVGRDEKTPKSTRKPKDTICKIHSKKPEKTARGGGGKKRGCTLERKTSEIHEHDEGVVLGHAAPA